MPTCKNCISKDVCQYKAYQEAVITGKDTSKLICIDNNVACKFFKDVSCYVHVPFKVGDTVYIPWHWDGQQGVAYAKVEEINIYDNQNHFMFLIDLHSDDDEFSQKYDGWKTDKSLGETVFLTPEEAETALAEGACYNA